MELRHLRYFVAVAETENMAAAARQLRVAQSALSRQIQDLEREIGAALFERHGRGLRVSAAGRTFFTHARAVLASADEAVRATRATAAGEEGLLKVAPPDVGAWIEVFGQAIEQFRAARPRVTIDVAPLSWVEHVAAVQTGQVDVGLTWATPEDIPPDIIAESLGFEPIDAAMLPARHPLASAQELTLAALRDMPLAMADRAIIGSLHDVSLAALRAGGYEPRVVGGMRTFAELGQFVATNGGWALVASSLAGAPPTGTVIRPLRDIPATRRLHAFAIRRGEPGNPLAAQFIELLRRRRSEDL